MRVYGVVTLGGVVSGMHTLLHTFLLLVVSPVCVFAPSSRFPTEPHQQDHPDSDQRDQLRDQPGLLLSPLLQPHGARRPARAGAPHR